MHRKKVWIPYTKGNIVDVLLNFRTSKDICKAWSSGLDPRHADAGQGSRKRKDGQRWDQINSLFPLVQLFDDDWRREFLALALALALGSVGGEII